MERLMSNLKYSQLDALVFRMTDADTGIVRKDRRYHLSTFSKCFIGKFTAVDCPLK